MYTLYSMQRSGNCYKVRLALAQLGIAHDIVEIDILKGDSRTPDFLTKNPNGQIPLLEVASGRYLPESNAILCFLGEGTPLLSDDPLVRAETLQWLFFEQHAIVPNIGAAYFWLALVKGGREGTGIGALAWVKEGERRGAGEILLTSWDRDGTRSGYDLALTRAVAEAFAAGSDAVLAASIFHDGDTTVADVKLHLMERGVRVRP